MDRLLKTNRSCETCRRRKKTCPGNGKDPCSICTERGLNCVYEVPQKRGPKAKFSNQAMAAGASSARPASRRRLDDTVDYEEDDDNFAIDGAPQSAAADFVAPQDEPLSCEHAIEARLFRLFVLYQNPFTYSVCKSIAYINELKLRNYAFLLSVYGNHRPVCDHTKGVCVELTTQDVTAAEDQVGAVTSDGYRSGSTSSGSSTDEATSVAADDSSSSTIASGASSSSSISAAPISVSSLSNEAASIAALEAMLGLRMGRLDSFTIGAGAASDGLLGSLIGSSSSNATPRNRSAAALNPSENALLQAHLCSASQAHFTPEATSLSVLQSAKALHYGILALGARVDGRPQAADTYITRCRAAAGLCWDTDSPRACVNLVSVFMILAQYGTGVLRSQPRPDMLPAQKDLGLPATYLSNAERLIEALELEGPPIGTERDFSASISSSGSGSSGFSASLSHSINSYSSEVSSSRLPWMTAIGLYKLVDYAQPNATRGSSGGAASNAAGNSSVGGISYDVNSRSATYNIASDKRRLSAAMYQHCATPRARGYSLIKQALDTLHPVGRVAAPLQWLGPQASALLNGLDEADAIIKQHSVGHRLMFALLALVELLRADVHHSTSALQPALLSVEKALRLLNNPLCRFAVHACLPVLLHSVPAIAAGGNRPDVLSSLLAYLRELGRSWPVGEAAAKDAELRYWQAKAALAAAPPMLPTANSGSSSSSHEASAGVSLRASSADSGPHSSSANVALSSPGLLPLDDDDQDGFQLSSLPGVLAQHPLHLALADDFFSLGPQG